MQPLRGKAAQPVSGHGWSVAFILAVAVVFGYPMLIYRMLPQGHDSIEHLQWYSCFADQLWRGELFPRWLQNMNAGLGSPSLFVYAPLPYYVAAFFRPVSWLLATPGRENFELGASLWIAFALSGLGMYFWLRSFLTKFAATAGAVVYLLVPYHLSIDLYTRSAVPEFWSFAWIPFALYFTFRVIHTRAASAIAGLMVSYALLVVTHLFTTVIFTPVLVGYGILLLEKKDRIPALQRLAVSLLLGTGLSAAYLLPALEHEKNIPASRLIELRPQYRYQRNFLFTDLQDHRARKKNLEWKLSWTTLSALAVVLITFFSPSMTPNRSARPERYWVLVSLASVAMMLPVSGFLWKAIPVLAALQFPWRFNIPLTVAAGVLAGIGVSHWSTAWRTWRHMIVIAGVGSILLAWIIVDANSVVRALPWKADMVLLVAGDYLYPAWAQYTKPELRDLGKVLELSRRISRGDDAAVALETSGSRSAEFNSNEPQSRWITLRRFYYPGWTATTKAGVGLPVRPSPINGLIDVQAPGGPDRIHLMLPWGMAEIAGIVVSVFSALIVVALLASGFGKRTELSAVGR